jgi:AAA+ ATPase superfamily predicted ATPase
MPPAASPPPFIGRERELDVLAELADSGRAELFVLLGRRRVGKTELLQRLCRDRRAVYFLAAQVRDRDNLRAFQRALQEGLRDPLFENVEFPDWAAALTVAAERAGDERLIVVLDEFPYLCEANRGLPSLVQRFWDQHGKDSSMMLVLCGSQVSFMEREVLAERSPLFGRRTAQRRLEPLAPSATLAFFPNWSRTDRLTAYAILGGMPAYLRRFDTNRSLDENLMREVLRPEGYLFDEVQYLLRTELQNPATYNSILGAIAQEAERVGDIALTVGVDSPTANKYLHVLRELRIVERTVPLTDADPLRSRRGVYRISDRFLSFHFRHVQPNLSMIEAGRGAQVLETFIRPDFGRLVDAARTDFILEHLRTKAADLVDEEIVEVGRFCGSAIKALARTVSGACVAALHGETGLNTLEQELGQVQASFKSEIRMLRYRDTEPSAGSLFEVSPYRLTEARR